MGKQKRAESGDQPSVRNHGLTGDAAFYANGARVRTTKWDLTIHFVRERPQGLTGKEFIREHVCDVSISLQLAKTLVGILAGQVMEYEKNVGPVPPGPPFTSGDGDDENEGGEDGA